MRMLRIGLVWLMVLAVSASAVAGDLHTSVANVARQQAAQQQQTPQVEGAGAPPTGHLVLGAALLAGGFGAAWYGFLHPISFGDWQPGHRAVGVAGLGGIIAGGFVLMSGQHAARSPSVTIGPHRVAVAKHLSW
jgi:hypothetical protein